MLTSHSSCTFITSLYQFTSIATCNLQCVSNILSSRNAFLQGDIQASHVGTKVTLDIGQGVKTLTHELYEAKAAQKRMDMTSILFRLAERSSELESRLESSDRELAALKRQKTSGYAAEGSGLLLDLDAKRSKQPKMQPKKPGMSAVNPASRKKKAAQGVQFD